MRTTHSRSHTYAEPPARVRESRQVRWHLVECGPADGEAVVFLHGVPDSWRQWHHALEALGSTYRCIAIDLKGYDSAGPQAPTNSNSARHWK
ncbi:alpha/beta fold hydrolase [Streptomyces gilvosporeus]|uniref:alpha/beta fold hydrolase n=1 Tax=Streptomyces gilvosporeus TaxID=553510 RepID=UPI001F3142F9|nr:alpha/beta fold hydrolase [Streptomyces gilvosporeus]